MNGLQSLSFTTLTATSLECALLRLSKSLVYRTMPLFQNVTFVFSKYTGFKISKFVFHTRFATVILQGQHKNSSCWCTFGKIIYGKTNDLADISGTSLSLNCMRLHL